MDEDSGEVVERLVPSKVLMVSTSGKSLELIMWRGEPAVIVDGKFVLRHTTLLQHLKEIEPCPRTKRSPRKR